MKQSKGLYRKHFGAEIVQALYDYDMQKIGPYKIPVQLTYVQSPETTSEIPMYRLYEEMLRSNDVLAVFSINNYCIGVLRCDELREVPIAPGDGTKELLMWKFDPVEVEFFVHIGFVKTYQKCLAVTEAPNFLLMGIGGVLDGFKTKVVGKPMTNPPYTLYKELIGNEQAKAVYYNLETQSPVFIYE